MTASPNNMNAAPISAGMYCENYYRNLLAAAAATNGAGGCTTIANDSMQPYSCSSNSSSNNNRNNVSSLIRPTDILSGRGRMAWNNKGNQLFRSIVHKNIQRYMDAKTNRDKTGVILSVLKYLQCEVGARFVKVQKGSVKVLGKREAHEKIGHAMRDLAKQRRDALAEAASNGTTTTNDKNIDTLATPKFVPCSSLSSTCSSSTASSASSELPSVIDDMVPVGFLTKNETAAIEPSRSMPKAALRRDGSVPLDTRLLFDCFGNNQNNSNSNITEVDFLDAFEPIPLAW